MVVSERLLVCSSLRSLSVCTDELARWGVAGAAYQIEGAAKDEGRGPSVWDVLSHRATGYVLNNVTADVTDVGSSHRKSLMPGMCST